MSLVAVVGRPNVGKSTLFNRLTEERQSIVDDMPGVTRDRIYGHVEWSGRTFSIVDTGGFVANSSDRFEAAIREQVLIALDEADLIILTVDVTTGVTDLDMEMATLIRKSEKPAMVLVNKADNEERGWGASEFYQLGIDSLHAVSAINGMGTGDFLDAVVAALPEEDPDQDESGRRFAIVGRPNVGKSSVTNALLGVERSIVTEIEGTTRDSIDSVLKYGDGEIVLVDTAGLRKRRRIKENVEFYSLLRTQRAIESCDVAILLVDAAQGLESQDIRVLKLAERLKKGLVIGLNKWDLVTKETNTVRDTEKSIRDRLKTLDYIPIVTASALTGQRLNKLLDAAVAVEKNRGRRVPTSKLNDTLLGAIERHHPPMYRGHRVRIKYFTQVREAPPVFNAFCNFPKGVDEQYRRFLENRIRETFNFEGVPITIKFKKK